MQMHPCTPCSGLASVLCNGRRVGGCTVQGSGCPCRAEPQGQPSGPGGAVKRCPLPCGSEARRVSLLPCSAGAHPHSARVLLGTAADTGLPEAWGEPVWGSPHPFFLALRPGVARFNDALLGDIERITRSCRALGLGRRHPLWV